MTVAALPPVEVAAAAEASRIALDREAFITHRIERIIAESPTFDRREVIAGVVEFHQQRMAATPSTSRFPDARPWVEHVLALDRRIMELANLSPQDMAIHRSAHDYMTFRGYRRFAGAIKPRPSGDERCRVARIPGTDQGTIHIKNVDDPIEHWKRRPPLTQYPWTDLVWDGTGSGLHLDDEPAEIFPLPVSAMCKHLCNDVPQAVEFLTRYCPFWSSANTVLYDRQGRSVSIDKCSRNFIDVHQPDARGRTHCSGMSCQDPQSPQARYQAQRRDEYRRLFGLPDEGTDATFWRGCAMMERRLADFLNQDRALTAAEIKTLFLTPRENGGLLKTGVKLHPQQAWRDFTLCVNVYYTDRCVVERWQRDPTTAQLDEQPERYAF